MNWNEYPNFSFEELRCKETFECDMNPEFMRTLQSIRDVYSRPMIISSGYRSPLHSKEIIKPVKGEHTKGLAVDVAVYGSHALDLIGISLSHGIGRIGVSQKGTHSQRFLHLGMGDLEHKEFLPGVWSY